MVTASAFAYSSCKTSSDPTPAKTTYKFTVTELPTQKQPEPTQLRQYQADVKKT